MAVLHFGNTTLTDWFLKRQATVETTTYSSEFIAVTTATEQTSWSSEHTKLSSCPHHDQGIYIW